MALRLNGIDPMLFRHHSIYVYFDWPCTELALTVLPPGRSNAMMDLTDDEADNFGDIALNTWDISVILACAGSRIRACLTHLQCEAEVTPWPSERVKYIRTGLQWELASFVVPFINYAISRSMVPTPSSIVKIILDQFSQNLLQPMPNHIFAARLMSIDPLTGGDDPSRMVDEYDREWWISGVSVDLTVPLPWDDIRKSVDAHPEGCALTIPALQAELGESSCLAQLFLIRERLRRVASEQVAEIEKLLGQARVQAQMIERLGDKRDPSVMHTVALGLPVSLLWRDNVTPSTTTRTNARYLLTHAFSNDMASPQLHRRSPLGVFCPNKMSTIPPVAARSPRDDLALKLPQSDSKPRTGPRFGPTTIRFKSVQQGPGRGSRFAKNPKYFRRTHEDATDVPSSASSRSEIMSDTCGGRDAA
ncbi:hypothetical protein F4604DRAFT_1688600 [Suillus subluteus]|nr:hypothetical protein F4604DRAFT_1688600 [Suillus subluteus]